MRKVLFIAYDFPPSSGIGAGLRSAHFTHYLPEFGWQPTVITLCSKQKIAPDVVCLPSPTPWHSPYELTPYGWAYALHRYLHNCKNNFDLVYVSCPPYPQALAAASFARRTKLPLVIDFRDAWSLDPYQEGSRLKRLLYRYLFPSMERSLMSKTNLLILNTPSALQAYQKLYPTYADIMTWIPNGYDEMKFPRHTSQSVHDELILLHAGRFGIGGRSPNNLLAGVSLARKRGCAVRLVILGNQSEDILTQVHASGLGDAVELRGQIDHSKAINDICSADVLVLLQAPSQASIQAVAGKTFEYLRSGRPILAIAPPGDNIDLIYQNADRYEHPEDNPQAIAQAITNLYREWTRGELTNNKVNPEFSEYYERRNLTSRLAAHFNQLLMPNIS